MNWFEFQYSLGADVFLNHEISEKNIKRLIDAMKAFRLLMNVNGVTAYKACATSAMREAKNAKTSSTACFG